MTLLLSLRHIIGTNGLASKLIRGGFGSLAVRIVSLGLEFVLAIILARTLAPEGYGIYAYAIALMRILAVPAQAGLPTLAVREVAAYHAAGDWRRLRGFLVRVNQIALGFSILIVSAATIAGATWFVIDEPRQATFWWSMALIPLIALGNIRGAILRGFGRVVEGQLPENVVRPAIFTVLAALGALLSAERLTPQWAMALHVVAAASAFGIGAWLLLRHLPNELASSPSEFESRRWILAAIPLSMIMGMMVLNNQAVIVILGAFRSSEDVGVYGVVAQLGLVVTVPVTAVNTAVAPYVSRLFVQRDFARLQWVASWSARAILIACVLIGGLLAGFAEPFITIAFGPQYVSGATALAILCAGQALSAVMGASMIILNMTRNERAVASSFFVAVVTNATLAFALIPSLGLVGAATAVSTSLIVLNAMMAYHVKKKLGLNPLAFSLTRARPK